MDTSLQLKAWMDYANADLDAAERLLASPDPNNWTFLLAAWHCHQAIEKMLKMVIISQGKENLKVHDLLRLIELSDVNFSSSQIDFCKELNQYYSHSRYPDMIYKPFPYFDSHKMQALISTTHKLFVWLKQQAQR